MEKQSLNLFYIDDNYITFLKNAGNKSVESNYANADNQKPYIGIVLTVNGNNYFAPLSSPKEKYKAMKDNNPTLFKIEKVNSKKLIGVVRLNNMIPVPEKALLKVDFKKIADLNYRNLLISQHKIMKANLSTIQNKAKTMYDLVVNKRNEFYCKLSNNFSKLEKDCQNFISNSVEKA